jgi:hypothetical protein
MLAPIQNSACYWRDRKLTNLPEDTARLCHSEKGHSKKSGMNNRFIPQSIGTPQTILSEAEPRLQLHCPTAERAAGDAKVGVDTSDRTVWVYRT